MSRLKFFAGSAAGAVIFTTGEALVTGSPEIKGMIYYLGGVSWPLLWHWLDEKLSA